MNPEDLRPTSLDGIVGQEKAVRVLKGLAEKTRAGGFPTPNLLFFGPPGVGKTTAAFGFARAALGPAWADNFREMNASDDRGIKVVRESIVPYVEAMPSDGAEFKLLFLDEADMLTEEAQSALRRVMETGSEATRFILAANRVANILDALRSRTVPVPFRPLSDDEIRRVVADAAKKIGLAPDAPTVESIVLVADGQARDAVQLLLGGSSEGPNFLGIGGEVERVFKGNGSAVDRVEAFAGWVRAEGFTDIERVLYTIVRSVRRKEMVPAERVPRVAFEAAKSAARIADGVAVPLLELESFLYVVTGAV